MPEDVSIQTGRLSDPAFVAKVRLVKTCLTNHSAFRDVPAFIPTLESLEEGANELEMNYMAVQNRDLTKAAPRKAARAALKVKFGKIGRYVDLACNGDLNLLKTTGYDLKAKGKAKPTHTVVLPAAELRLVHGGEGVIIIRGKKVALAAGYQVQVTEGDPSSQEGWRDFGTFRSCSAIELSGLTPGKTYSVRMRCIAGTTYGPWSVPCTLMAH